MPGWGRHSPSTWKPEHSERGSTCLVWEREIWCNFEICLTLIFYLYEGLHFDIQVLTEVNHTQHCVCIQVLFPHQKKISVEDWGFPVQFWPWTPPVSVFPPRYYRSTCDYERDWSNIKPFKVQRNTARDAEPPQKVRCNAGTQARQLRWTYIVCR